MGFQKYNVHNFKLEEFFEKMTTGTAFSLRKPSSVTRHEVKETAQQLMTLLKNGIYVYTSFTTDTINLPYVSCINDKKYMILTENEYMKWVVEGGKQEDNFVPTTEFQLWEEDSVGFLLKLEGETLKIWTVHFLMDGMNGIDDAGTLESPMKQFLTQYCE